MKNWHFFFSLTPNKRDAAAADRCAVARILGLPAYSGNSQVPGVVPRLVRGARPSTAQVAPPTRLHGQYRVRAAPFLIRIHPPR